MGLNLVKGSSLPMTKEDNTKVKNVLVNLSWNPNEGASPYAFDLDVMSAACHSADLKAAEAEVAYFAQKNTTYIKVSPDSLNGEGDGVDEFLKINLDTPDNITHIPVLVYIYDASRRGQSFAQVDGCSVQIIDEDTGTVLGECNISEHGGSSDESLLVGVFERQADGSFKYQQVNQFFKRSLNEWASHITA